MVTTWIAQMPIAVHRGSLPQCNNQTKHVVAFALFSRGSEDVRQDSTPAFSFNFVSGMFWVVFVLFLFKNKIVDSTYPNCQMQSGTFVVFWFFFFFFLSFLCSALNDTRGMKQKTKTKKRERKETQKGGMERHRTKGIDNKDLSRTTLCVCVLFRHDRHLNTAVCMDGVRNMRAFKE